MRIFELVLNVEKNCTHCGHEIQNQTLADEKIFCSEKQAARKDKKSESDVCHHDTLA